MALEEHLKELRRYILSREDDEAARHRLLRSLQRIDGVRRIPVERGDILTEQEIEAVINVAERKRKIHKKCENEKLKTLKALNFQGLKDTLRFFIFGISLIAAYSIGGIIMVVFVQEESGRAFWEPFFRFLSYLCVCATVAYQIRIADRRWMRNELRHEVEMILSGDL